MPGRNFLLGRGERLTEDVFVAPSGGPKAHPYSFDEAQGRLGPMITSAAAALEALPDEACPQDKAIASITLHPEYLAKSGLPRRGGQSTKLESDG